MIGFGSRTDAGPQRGARTNSASPLPRANQIFLVRRRRGVENENTVLQTGRHVISASRKDNRIKEMCFLISRHMRDDCEVIAERPAT